MELQVLDIGNNVAAFGRIGQPKEQKGLMYWTNPVHISEDKHSLTVSGRNTLGFNFEPQDVQIKVKGDVNPTKVFWAIYKALDKLVCPNCDRGF